MIALKTHGRTPDQIAFSPDGTLLGVSGMGLSLRVYDTFGGELLWQTEPRERDMRIGNVHFSPDSRHVFMVWIPELVFDARTGKPNDTLPEDRQPGGAEWSSVDMLAHGVGGGVLSSDGRWASGPQPLTLTDRHTERRIDFYPFMGLGHNEKKEFPLWALAPMTFSPDGSLFVGADTVRLHVFRCEDLIALAAVDRKKTRKLPVTHAIATLKSVRKHFQSAVFTPDGGGLMTGTNDGLVRVWDTATWQDRSVYDWKTGPVKGLTLSADGTRAAVAGTRKIVIWDLDG